MSQAFHQFVRNEVLTFSAAAERPAWCNSIFGKVSTLITTLSTSWQWQRRRLELASSGSSLMMVDFIIATMIKQA